MAGRGRPFSANNQPGPSSSVGRGAPAAGGRLANPSALFDMDLSDLFGTTRMPIRRTLTGGRGIVKVIEPMERVTLETGSDYANRIQLEAEEKAIQSRKKLKTRGSDGNGLNTSSAGAGDGSVYEPSVVATTNLEDISTIVPSEKPNLVNFDAFNLSKSGSGSAAVKILPIEAHKQEIIRAIRMNQVTIIEGTTGCGKTTRVPYYIMEDAVKNEEQFHIVVTQPRRIAAVSVAKRVASSCNQTLGGMIGYQIGLDRQFVSPDTHLLYCTTGVLHEKVINSKREGRLALEYTHIVIDEIHERNVETDLLLMILRRYIWESAPDLKLILMSATFQTQRFVDYFSMKTIDPDVACLKPQVVSIPEKVNKLSIFYLEEFEGKFELPKRSDFTVDDPQLVPELYDVCLKIIKNFTVIEAQNRRARGAVLIFLPGINEIQELFGLLSRHNSDDPSAKFWLLPLHSCINDEQQRLVFDSPRPGERKIILATNIAESSITVTDIEYVIDFCLTKNMVVDKQTNLPTLMLEWATQASTQQRAGRAGRVMDGRAFRLVFSTFHRNFEKYPKAEILNIPLENCILSAKILDMGRPKEILALCLDPPKLEDIRTAVLKLKRAGGLSIMNEDGEYDPEDGVLTAVGRLMRALPIDINAAKLIILGYATGFVEETVIMAACLTVSCMFERRFGEELNSYKSRLAWSERSFCDLTSYLNAYRAYEKIKRYKAGDDVIKNFCKTNFLQLKRVGEVINQVDDLKRRLERIKISIDKPPNETIDPVERELILKFIMAGAFYPNYFLRRPVDPAYVAKQISGHNVYSSVIISGLPYQQGILYADQIKQLMRPASDMIELDFEETKVIVNFCNEKDPLEQAIKNMDVAHFMTASEVEEAEKVKSVREARIKNAVYVAVKMRKLNRDIPLTIKMVNSEAARHRVSQLTHERDERFDRAHLLRTSRFHVPSFQQEMQIAPPAFPMRNRFKIRVVHVVQCGHFYAQYVNEEADYMLRRIRDAVHSYEGERLLTARCGMVVLVPFEDTVTQHIEFQRAVIIDRNEEEKKFQILKVDFGGKEWIELDPEMAVIDKLHSDNLPDIQLPAQAFECFISEIKASSFRNPNGVWVEAATEFFQEIVDANDGIFDVEMYSVVGDVYRMRLKTKDRIDVSEILMDEGWAESSEESLKSRQNFEARQRCEALEQDMSILSESNHSLYSVPLSQISLPHSKKSQALKGPNSPLECDFQSVSGNQFNTVIHIDGKSVNSVALEPEPESEFQRMLISAVTSFSNESKKVVARETSLMPPIRGLPALACLIFSPRCELRYDKNKHLLYSLVCGLGGEKRPDGRTMAYDSKNDMELSFDVLFTKEDLMEVNAVRYLIGILLDTRAAGRYDMAGQPLFLRQQMIRSSILALLRRRRMKLPPCANKHNNFQWGLIPPDEMAEEDESMKKTGFAVISPVIDDFINFAEIEIELFRNISASDFGKRSVSCPLDGEMMSRFEEMHKHWDSKDHKNRKAEMDRQLLDQVGDAGLSFSNLSSEFRVANDHDDDDDAMDES